MNKLEKSKILFQNGFNCCQAVFVPFALEKGLDENMALKISSGFAAGLCFNGETCGAVVGAQMALGLESGYTEADDDLRKNTIKEDIAAFRRQFAEKNGTTTCKDLLGKSPAIESDLVYLRENNIFKEKCPGFVSDAVQITEKVLKV